MPGGRICIISQVVNVISVMLSEFQMGNRMIYSVSVRVCLQLGRDFPFDLELSNE